MAALSNYRLPMTRAVVFVCVAVLASLPACSEEAATRGNEPLDDPARAAVIAAIPPEVVERGVFVYDPSATRDLFPGTFSGPDLGIVLSEADWIAESGVPPLVVASGVDAAEPPRGVEVVEGLLIAAADPPEGVAAAERVRQGVDAEGLLARLTAASAPLSWAGPATRANRAAGRLGDALIHMGGNDITISVEAPDPEAAAGAIEEELSSGGIPSSPGRTWDLMLVEPHVSAEDGSVMIQAQVGDFPALLLRQLIDSGSLGFLTSG